MKKDWTYKKLGEVTTTINGLWTGKKPPFVNVAVVRNTNFTKDCKLDMTNVAYLDVEEKQFSTRKLQYGDIIIEKSGGSEKQPVGRPVLFNINEGDYSFSNFTSTLRINNKEELDPHFLHYSPVGAYFRGVTGKMQAKTTGIHNLDFKAYLKLLIPTPSLPEQQQIVAELDLLSDVIEKQKAQIEELNKLSQSIFYDMFGDPVTNEKGWNIIQLGEKCEVTSFKRVLIEEVVEKGVPFIRGTELTALSKMVKGEKFDFTLFITPEHYERVKAISGVPKIGDLLIPSINADGNIWVLDTEEPRYYKDGRVLWVHVNNEAYTSQALKFIMQIMLKDTYSDMASGATFAELKLFVLRELKVILPPLSLQQEFAAKIEAIEAMKAKVRQSLKESEELFNSRMDYYFN